MHLVGNLKLSKEDFNHLNSEKFEEEKHIKNQVEGNNKGRTQLTLEENDSPNIEILRVVRKENKNH